MNLLGRRLDGWLLGDDLRLLLLNRRRAAVHDVRHLLSVLLGQVLHALQTHGKQQYSLSNSSPFSNFGILLF